MSTITIPYSNDVDIVAVDCKDVKQISRIQITILQVDLKVMGCTFPSKIKELGDDDNIDVNLEEMEKMDFGMPIVENMQDLTSEKLLCGASYDIYIASSDPMYYVKKDGSHRLLFQVKSGLEKTLLKINVSGEYITSIKHFKVLYKSDQQNPFCENDLSYLESIFQK